MKNRSVLLNKVSVKRYTLCAWQNLALLLFNSFLFLLHILKSIKINFIGSNINLINSLSYKVVSDWLKSNDLFLNQFNTLSYILCVRSKIPEWSKFNSQVWNIAITWQSFSINTVMEWYQVTVCLHCPQTCLIGNWFCDYAPHPGDVSVFTGICV